MPACLMRRLLPPLIGCLTLGLAPFVPEPHVVGKLRWLLGGARGMTALDWFDLVMHGAPWLWLLAALIGWTTGETPEGTPPRWLRWAIVGAVLAGLTCVLWTMSASHRCRSAS